MVVIGLFVPVSFLWIYVGFVLANMRVPDIAVAILSGGDDTAVVLDGGRV